MLLVFSTAKRFFFFINRLAKLLLFWGFGISLIGCASNEAPVTDFRAVWIATVNNIDWPLPKQTDPEAQRQSFIEYLDFYQKLNFNAVVVQIRAAGDAFYPTDLAPWSQFLSGKQGEAPNPSYDPVAFMIEACHERGMEFHAWLNPYRATVQLDTSQLSQQHVYYQHPDWIIRYGGRYYLNPGLPEVQQHVVEIITEVCRKYDIDGVHFDDYFYPYQIADATFGDSLAYQEYGQQQFSSVDDWRRDNVNSLIQTLHEEIERVHPGLPFGISPFGVWRNQDQDPRGSKTAAIQTTYDHLYADCVNWMEKGWIDYIAPQLYFSMNYQKAAYHELANWWAKIGKETQVPVYTGMGIYKVENNHDSAWYDPQQIPQQLHLNNTLPQIKGQFFFSAKSLPGKPNLSHQLQQRFFQSPALPFSRGWRSDISPVIDSLAIKNQQVSLHLQNTDSLQLESLIVFSTSEPYAKPEVYCRQWPQSNATYTIPLTDSIHTLSLAYLDQNRRLSLLTNPIVLGQSQ